MGLFSRKKKLPEQEAPGFAELEVSDEDLINSPPVLNSEDENVKLPEQLPEIPRKKKNLPDLPEDADNEEDIRSKKLPEIPGMLGGKGDNKKDEEKYDILPTMNKELPKKMTMDVREAEEHPERILSKRMKPEKTKDDFAFDQSDRSVFIKIEDFNSITFAIQEIKNKVSMIDRDIVEIKSIKSRQDSELLAWEREMVEIKEMLSSIDAILKRKIQD